MRRPGRRQTSRPARRITAARELREREVALARHPDPDRRRVPEHGVELEVRAGDEIHDVQDDDERERDDERSGRMASTDRETRGRDQRRRRRTGTPSTRRRCRCRRSSTDRRGTWRRGTRAPRARPTARPVRRRRPRASMNPVASASSAARTSTAVYTPLDARVAEHPVLVRVDEEVRCAPWRSCPARAPA